MARLTFYYANKINLPAPFIEKQVHSPGWFSQPFQKYSKAFYWSFLHSQLLLICLYYIKYGRNSGLKLISMIRQVVQVKQSRSMEEGRRCFAATANLLHLIDISRLNRTKQERRSIFPVTPPYVNKRGSVNLKT